MAGHSALAIASLNLPEIERQSKDFDGREVVLKTSGETFYRFLANRENDPLWLNSKLETALRFCPGWQHLSSVWKVSSTEFSHTMEV